MINYKKKSYLYLQLYLGLPLNPKKKTTHNYYESKGIPNRPSKKNKIIKCIIF